MLAEEGRCLLAADAARAVGHDGTLFELLDRRKKVREIAEVLHRERDRISELPHSSFIVIAHVDEHEVIASLECFVELLRRDVRRCILRGHITPERHHFIANTDEELAEDVILMRRFLERDALEQWMTIEVRLVDFTGFGRAGARPIDPFCADENSPTEIQALTESSLDIRFGDRVRNVDVLVEEENVHRELVKTVTRV